MNNTTENQPLSIAEKDAAAFVEKLEQIEQEVLTEAWLRDEEDTEKHIPLIEAALDAAQQLQLFARTQRASADRSARRRRQRRYRSALRPTIRRPQSAAGPRGGARRQA